MKSLGGSRQPWLQHTMSEALGKSSHLSELHVPPQSHPPPTPQDPWECLMRTENTLEREPCTWSEMLVGGTLIEAV